jgi:hypothetical protein
VRMTRWLGKPSSEEDCHTHYLTPELAHTALPLLGYVNQANCKQPLELA